MKMSEDARAQLARHKNLSPKSLISPKKSGPFGSPIARVSDVAGPLDEPVAALPLLRIIYSEKSPWRRRHTVVERRAARGACVRIRNHSTKR